MTRKEILDMYLEDIRMTRTILKECRDLIETQNEEIQMLKKNQKVIYNKGTSEQFKLTKYPNLDMPG